MHTLVNRLDGTFSITKLKKVIPQLEVLEKQPPLPVDKIYADKNPEFFYRLIGISKVDVNKRVEGSQVEYHVMDMGRVEDVSYTVPLASKVYFEEDIEKLK